MKKLLLATALAALGFATAANAAINTITVTEPSGDTVTVTQVAPEVPGTFDNDPLGAKSGVSSAIYNGALGPISFVAGADSQGVVQGTTSGYAAPAGDTSHYLYGDADPTTVTFGSAASPVQTSSFLIYWGSIDALSGPSGYNNVLALLSNGDAVTGSELVGFFTPPVNGAGNQTDANDNKWFLISDTAPFTSFSVSTSNGSPAFEFDMGVPELSTWAMMLLGFVGLGLAGRRAGRKIAAPA